jgi:anaerobic selenocysteine-containing dehydrogenase
VNLCVHHSLYYDETSFLCHWHVPDTHYLETWSDVCAFDGTVSIIQPLIAPLYGGKSPHQILDLLLDRPETDAGEALREEVACATRRWRQLRRVLEDGAPPRGRRREYPATRLRPSRSRGAGRYGAPRQPGRRGHRSHFPARSGDLGRQVREQRLAPGAAAASDEAHVGQRCAREPAHRARAGRRE